MSYDDDRFEPDRSVSKAELDAQKARHERIKADKAELDLEVQRGRYLERTAVVEASAVAHAVLAQTLRSLRDTLERKYALDGDVLDAVNTEIDAALSNVSTAYRMLAEG